tara:strand:- start:782 stop:1057 length:276 start_codon:yes stop_codon:yes gene_type:complete
MPIGCSMLDFDLRSCHQSHPSLPHLVGLVVTNHFCIDLIGFRIKVKVNLVKLGLSLDLLQNFIFVILVTDIDFQYCSDMVLVLNLICLFAC